MKFLELPGQGAHPLPDIANVQHEKAAGTLDWVGMSDIEIPVQLVTADGMIMQTSAKAQAYVNLINPQAKGIHMSRLYLLVDELSTLPLNMANLSHILEEFLESHKDLSDQAYIQVSFDYLVRRPSLQSEFSGWKAYPVKVGAYIFEGKVHVEIRCDIPYSSTCPCSAALARQLIQQQFAKDFEGKSTLDTATVLDWLGSEEGIVATPHSQRSIANVKVKLRHDGVDVLPIIDIVDVVEEALQTPVQAAVKREDEQAFALLNGKNLMFCEDAGRRIQEVLNKKVMIEDFWVRVNHMESLHAHDAVSVVTKGVAGGYAPIP